MFKVTEYAALKWRSSFFRLILVFPILIAQMIFSQIQQAPGPDFRKVRKIADFTASAKEI